MSIGAALRRAVHTSGKLDLSRPYLTMFDDIQVALLPAGPYAYGGYVGGHWPTFAELVAKFEGHPLLDIAINRTEDATGLDIEEGDADITDGPGWYERQVKRGVYRPVLYCSASKLKALELVMRAAHVERAAYRLWSAHYTGKPHICGPKSCGYGLSEADGTQWTSNALGRNLDQSLLLPTFFAPRPAPVVPPAPKPVPEPPAPVDPPKPAPEPVPAPVFPTWEEVMMNALPTLKQGDVDKTGENPAVRVMQSCIVAQGHAHKIEAAVDNKVDGDFGTKTTNALLAIQEAFGLHDTDEYKNRVCGPDTWRVLVTGEK